MLHIGKHGNHKQLFKNYAFLFGVVCVGGFHRQVKMSMRKANVSTQRMTLVIDLTGVCWQQDGKPIYLII